MKVDLKQAPLMTLRSQIVTRLIARRVWEAHLLAEERRRYILADPTLWPVISAWFTDRPANPSD